MRAALGTDYPQWPFTELIFFLMATTKDLTADGRDTLRLIHLTFPGIPNQINRYLPPWGSSDSPSCPADGKPATTGVFNQIHGCSSSALLICSLHYEIKLFVPAVLAKPGQLWCITLGLLWLPPSWLLLPPLVWHHALLGKDNFYCSAGKDTRRMRLGLPSETTWRVPKTPFFILCGEATL